MADTSTPDLVDRLRDPEWISGDLCVDAADRIESQAAEIERLQAQVDRERATARRYHPAWRVLVDLDRNTRGRHFGDVDSADLTGKSRGNPYAPPDRLRIGTTMLGQPITWQTLNDIVRPKEASADE